MLLFSKALLRTMVLALLFRTSRAWVSTTRTAGVNSLARRRLGQANTCHAPAPHATATRLWSSTPAVRSIPKRFVPFPFEVSTLSLWMYEKINESEPPRMWVQKNCHWFFLTKRCHHKHTSFFLYDISINRN
jgi:hypothetical protein